MADDDDEVSGSLGKLTKESLAELFQMLDRAPLKSQRATLLDRNPNGLQQIRVSPTERRVTPNPHHWRNTKPDRKIGVVDWECTKCGALSASGPKIRPDPHAVPTCNDVMIDGVHDQ